LKEEEEEEKKKDEKKVIIITITLIPSVLHRRCRLVYLP